MIETKQKLKELMKPLPSGLVRIIAHKEKRDEYRGGFNRDESKEVTFIVECRPEELEKTIAALMSKGFDVK